MWQFKKCIMKISNTFGECPMSLGNDSGTFVKGGSKTIFVLDNDGVITAPIVTITVAPSNGTAVVNPDKSITYTHNNGTSTTDLLIYQVSNGECSSTATVSYYLATSPPSYYAVFISNSTSISNCSGAGVSTYPIQVFIERSPIIIGDIIYSNSALTTTFTGDGTWYSMNSKYSMRINTSGVVTAIDNSCAPLE